MSAAVQRAATSIDVGKGFVALGCAADLSALGGEDTTSPGPDRALANLPTIVKSAPLLVVSDYALLRDPLVLSALESATPVRLGLLAPVRLSTALSAEAVARDWSYPQNRRATLASDEIAELGPFLDARTILIERQHHNRREVRRHLRTVAPAYADLVEGDADLTRLLPIVRAHPTPRALRSAGAITLNRALVEAGASSRHRLLEVLLCLQQEMPPASDPHRVRLVETLIPGLVDALVLLEDRVLRIDEEIFEIASRESYTPRSTRPVPLLWARGADVPGPAGSERTAQELLGQIRAALCRLHQIPVQSMSAEEQFRGAYEVLGQPGSPALTPRERLEIELAGQRLTLACGNFRAALHHRGEADDALEVCSREPEELPAGLLADARLVAALTEVLVVDLVTGFGNLRSALESDTVLDASPELATEAFGLLALILVLFGETAGAADMLAVVDRRAAQYGDGAMLAPALVARLFLHGSRISTSATLRATLVADARRASQGTAYWPYFHYAVMLTNYLGKDSNAARASFTEIQRDGQWPSANPRFDRLSRLCYAAHLAAQGEFAAAHRELSSLAKRRDGRSDGADEAIHALISMRLQLAAGANRTTLAMTASGGPLGEHRIGGTHLSRYLPAALLLRGTALTQQGALGASAELFRRATEQAHLQDEYLTLLCAETQEYREWLEGLDPELLPPGILRGVVEALLASPPFIQHRLPPLTQQQERVLRLLAMDRSITSIAAELHISQNTIKSHLRKLYRRLAVNSRGQAVLFAESYGFFH